MTTAYLQYLPNEQHSVPCSPNVHYQQILLNEAQPQQGLTNNQTAYLQTLLLSSAASSLPKNLVFFDWDDTIIPTTALFGKQCTSLDHFDAKLERFGKSAYELLLKFIDVYSAENIYIVTNGVTGWIQNSLKILSARQPSGVDYWAIIHQLLSTTFQGRVISARSLYEPLYPDRSNSALWKTLVFQEIAIRHFGPDFNGKRVIISVGDSTDEFIASKETTKFLQSQYGRDQVDLVTMKLESKPSMSWMMVQFVAITVTVKALNDKPDTQSVDFRIAETIEYAMKTGKYRGADATNVRADCKGLKEHKQAVIRPLPTNSLEDLSRPHLNPMAPIFSM